MRTKLGWTLSGLGIVVGLLGAAVMILLGPDSRFTTGPHALETDGVAVVTTPKVISWANVRIDVLAEVPARKPIFVGLANSVDVQSYVAKSQRLEITGFARPWQLESREVEGRPNLPGAPTALDWWLEGSAGLGGASISTVLPDETVSLAVVSVGDSNLVGLTVTMAYGVTGGFAKGLALLLSGLAAVWGGLLVRRGGAFVDDVPDQDDDVIYVYVDDDGVEHEISAEEAAEFDVVDEEVVELAPLPDDASDHAASDDDVVYVYVDDDGVEHEIGPDELAEFELLDDEEDRP